MKKKIIIFVIIMMSLFMTGCSNYNSDFTTDEAKKMMKDYIKEKYGEEVDFKYVKFYNEVALGEIKNLGYYAKTTDGYYIRLTDFKGEENVDIRDTKQFSIIEKKVNEYIENNEISNNHIVSIKLPKEENETEFFRALWSGYDLDSKYDNGDIREFLYNNNAINESYYEVDVDTHLDINIAFFTNNNIDKEKISSYARTLSEEFNCEVTVALSYEEYEDSSKATIFTDSSNPFISKSIYKNVGNYNDEKQSEEKIDLSDSVSINSSISEEKLNKSDWTLKEANLNSIKLNDHNYKILTKGYNFITTDSSYYNILYFSININDIDTNEDLYLLACNKDKNGWYVTSTYEIKNQVSSYEPFIINDKLVFNTTYYSQSNPTYYFLARIDK